MSDKELFDKYSMPLNLDTSLDSIVAGLAKKLEQEFARAAIAHHQTPNRRTNSTSIATNLVIQLANKIGKTINK